MVFEDVRHCMGGTWSHWPVTGCFMNFGSSSGVGEASALFLKIDSVMFQFLKIIKSGDQHFAVCKYKRTDNKYSEGDLRHILKGCENGVGYEPPVLASEVEKGLRAMLIAKDGGLQSILNPGRI